MHDELDEDIDKKTAFNLLSEEEDEDEFKVADEDEEEERKNRQKDEFDTINL